jgi:hypothetical protein
MSSCAAGARPLERPLQGRVTVGRKHRQAFQFQWRDKATLDSLVAAEQKRHEVARVGSRPQAIKQRDIRAERQKNDKSHVVHLNLASERLLNRYASGAARKVDSDLVFTTTRRGWRDAGTARLECDVA